MATSSHPINPSRSRLWRLLTHALSTFLLAAFVAGASTSAVFSGEIPNSGSAPNVVLILADDLGYGDLSCFGAEDLRSPNVDGLGEGGIRFSNFYANCPVCSPTRAALLSGRYQELVGVPGVIRTYPQDNWGYLAHDAVLLPALLKKVGYHTAIVGKWHLGLEAPNRPNDRGFDLFRGFLGDMMDDYYLHRRHKINYMRHNTTEIDPPGHATDLFSQWAVEYLKQRAAHPEQPFFLYLAYNAPHTPIQPPEDWLRKVKQREPKMTERRAKLVALIEHMDHGIGQVLQTLEDTSLAANTLVLFTSDNGGQLSVGANNGPYRDGKQSVYEGGLRVPMLARWPGQIKPATDNDTMALTMDLFPTVLEAAGAKIPTNLDGRTILATLRGLPQELPERDVFFSRREGGTTYGGKTIDAVRRGPWKLLQNSPWQPLELYNLADDSQETTDLRKQHARVFSELSAAMRGHIQRRGGVPWQKPQP